MPPAVRPSRVFAQHSRVECVRGSLRPRPKRRATSMARMDGDVDIAALGALLSDASRCRLLFALTDGRALAASVLASEAGVSPSTASEHLGKLLDAALVRVEAQGRHRYCRLAGPNV